MEKKIYVYENWSSDTPKKPGTLFIDSIRDNELVLSVDTVDTSISIDLAIETAKYYSIDESDAKKYASKILTTVKNNWETLASRNGLSRGEIENMQPAFRESEKCADNI